MSQYNDRPKVPQWQKPFMGSRFPRDARRDFCVFTFCMQFFLFVMFSLATLALGFGMGYPGALFALLMLLFAYIFGKDACSTFKAILESKTLSDVDALWKMEYESIGMKSEDFSYARAWVDTFPELAERIDPETGNVDLRRDTLDKPWWEVKVGIRSMIHNCPAAQKAPKRKGTGRHSY